MGSVLPFLVATPLFGFALSLDPSSTVGVTAPVSVVAVSPSIGTVVEAEAAPTGPTPAQQMERRAHIANVHKWLGISSFSAMTLAVAAGVVQYRNLYAGGSSGATPCGRGDAWPSQATCTGPPVGHLTLGLVTGALYYTTFGLSFAMPDPYHVSEGNSPFARRLRAHKALRWVHFSGMVAQMLLGMVIANGQWFGLDRANDYGTLRALSTVHLAVGGVTWMALGTAGALMAF